jgi:hypothetical protein
MTRVSDLVERELTSWPGVAAAPHRFGGVEFRLGRRELGHLHGDRVADLPFTRRVRDELIAQGRVTPHHVEWLRDSGWGSFWISGPDDVPALVDLFREQYERAVASAERAAARTRPAG